MIMKFMVGETEKHEIKFTFNKMWGTAKIFCDDKKVMGKLKLFMGQVTNYKVTIGNDEKHEIRIEQKRPLMFAGFRGGWQYNAFVDEKQVMSKMG